MATVPKGTQMQHNDGRIITADGSTNFGSPWTQVSGSPVYSQQTQASQPQQLSGLELYEQQLAQARAGINNQTSLAEAERLGFTVTPNTQDQDVTTFLKGSGQFPGLPGTNQVTILVNGRPTQVTETTPGLYGKLGYQYVGQAPGGAGSQIVRDSQINPGSTTDQSFYNFLPGEGVEDYKKRIAQKYETATGNTFGPFAQGSSEQGAGGSGGLVEDYIATNPFLSELFSDPAFKDIILNLPPESQSVFFELGNALQTKLKTGNILNPDIEISPAMAQQFLNQATSELDPYFREQLGFLSKDIETSLGRLQEDYTRGVQRSEDPFKQRLEQQAESEAQSGTAFSSGRQVQEQRLVTQQQQSLDDALRGTTRSAQDLLSSGERRGGTSALSSLSIPGVQEFGASLSGYTPRGSRTLGGFQGGIMGEIPKSREVAIQGRSSELATDERLNRILDLRNL